MSLAMGYFKCKLTVGVLLVLLFATTIAARQNEEAPLQPEFSFHPTPKTHVVISNTFGDGVSLTVHCKSGDEDLGEKVVGPGGNYEIVFYPSVFLNTLYYCKLSSPHGWLELDAYRGTRDVKRCYKLCLWTASDDVVSGYNILAQADINYSWNH